MRLATIIYGQQQKIAIRINSKSADQQYLLLDNLIDKYGLDQEFRKYNSDMLSLIADDLTNLVSWYKEEFDETEVSDDNLLGPPLQFKPLYDNPDKIWGIGLNYKEHAQDLDENTPEGFPASFMKPRSTIIGHLDTIKIPKLSERTTGEAELGIIIGKGGRNIRKEDWLEHVAGFTTILDMTAEDILRQNPRYLTLSKSFDSFLSFGPELITADEFSHKKVMDLEVATVINNKIHSRNSVHNMTFGPNYLVSFHSEVMTLQPGDIISTGTPGAALLNHGDEIETRISGFQTLRNNVVDLK